MISEYHIPKNSKIALVLYTGVFEDMEEYEVLLINGLQWVTSKKNVVTTKSGESFPVYDMHLVSSDILQRRFIKHCTGKTQFEHRDLNDCKKRTDLSCIILNLGALLGYDLVDKNTFESYCEFLLAKNHTEQRLIGIRRYRWTSIAPQCGVLPDSDVIGSGSSGQVYLYCEKAPRCVVIKKTIFYDNADPRLAESVFEGRSPRDSLNLVVQKGVDSQRRKITTQAGAEIAASRKVTSLVANRICPHYVILHDAYTCDEERDSVYLVLEYIAGRNLSAYIYDPNTSDANLLSVLQQVIIAIHTMYSRIGLVHGDLHPDNVMVSTRPIPFCTEYILNSGRKRRREPERRYVYSNATAFITDFGRAYIHDEIEIEHYMKSWYPQQLKEYSATMDTLDLRCLFTNLADTIDGSRHPKSKQMVDDILTNSEALESRLAESTLRDAAFQFVLKMLPSYTDLPVESSWKL